LTLPAHADAAIARACQTITLTPAQHAAVRAIVEWYRGGSSTPQEFYLAGYAGTGKSTIATVALQELRDKCGVHMCVSAR
jgi:DNA replication protein DnaC